MSFLCVRKVTYDWTIQSQELGSLYRFLVHIYILPPSDSMRRAIRQCLKDLHHISPLFSGNRKSAYKTPSLGKMSSSSHDDSSLAHFSWENGSRTIPKTSHIYPDDPDSAILPSGDNVQRVSGRNDSQPKYWSINGVVAGPKSSTCTPSEISWSVETGQPAPTELPQYHKFTYCDLGSFADWLISGEKGVPENGIQILTPKKGCSISWTHRWKSMRRPLY